MARALPLVVAMVVAFLTNLVLDVALGAPLWLRWIVAVAAAVVAGALVGGWVRRRTNTAEPRRRTPSG